MLVKKQIGKICFDYLKPIVTIVFIFFLLLMPVVFNEVKHPNSSFLITTQIFFFSCLYLLVPIVVFYRNIRLYLYLLILFIIITPFFLFGIVLFDIKPGIDLAFLIMQTNKNEVSELLSLRLMLTLLLSTLLYLLVFLYLIKKISYRTIPFKTALFISLISFVIISVEFYNMIGIKKEKYLQYFERYYPISFVFGIYKTHLYFKENNIDQSKNFAFHVTKDDIIGKRQIHILIIGESARYDRWGINGYSRNTSPKLSKRKSVISFSDVVAGGYLTSISVPQIITRAEPDNLSLQYKEKSIMAAFKEAGYKTAWISNQSGRGVFTDGTITAHAKTADYSVFNPYESYYSNSIHYDEKLLTVLDSIINYYEGNQFIVLHTIGNHWNYIKRYPKSFDYFRPSGYIKPIFPPTIENKEALLNSYDNGIRYTDFIIDSVIGIVDKHQAVSSVTYVSDHGEDLFEHNQRRSNFHLNASIHTLKIPLFIWTSSAYQQAYPLKQEQLLKNRNKKISSAGNIFYTLLNMANISFKNFAYTKSLASPCYENSRQLYYEPMKKAVISFDQIAQRK